ncbi:hypothetical protein SAMN05216231_1325 [Virgibacillus salinus]|uniref:Uncharacterized protein n=1 Tax=Virgibacillus salinus TaxID=553311 RepID=A0A1H0ZMS4_9BACI|nr:hypothetical protein SAMN05216231_1325 [Virgibacillus salinus]
MKISEEETATDQLARNVYKSPLNPGIVGFGVVAIPHWSTIYFLIWGLIIALLVLRVFLGI